jgi:alcohol dehydrogenase class IV
LTSLFDIPHGIAVILTFEEVLHLNLEASSGISEIPDIFGGTDGLREWLERVTDGSFHLSLSVHGISDAELPLIAAGSCTKGRMDNNPIDIHRDDLERILKKIL